MKIVYRGYIVTSPSVFRANINHVISVRVFNHSHPVRVNAKLLDPQENVIASVSAEITSAGNLTLKVMCSINLLRRVSSATREKKIYNPQNDVFGPRHGKKVLIVKGSGRWSH